MKTLEDYENRIDHLDEEGTINHSLCVELKHRVGNMIGRKYEHLQFLEDEKAYINTTVSTRDNDIVIYARLLDRLKYGLN